MTRAWVLDAAVASGRLVAVAGAALTVGAVAGIVGGWAYEAFRYAPDWNVGLLPVVLPLQAVVAGWVLRSALRLGTRPLLRSMLLAGFGSLIVLYGWYFLLVGEGVIGIAIGNLLYLLAGLLVVPAALVGNARGPGNTRREPAPRATGAGARVLGGVLFVAVAAAAGYAAIPTIPPPEAQTLGPPNQPALSCPQGKEEIASFEGSGDRVTPAFETTGSLWGYEFASVGYGTLRIGVLSETGDVVPHLDEPSPAGSGGSAEFALGPGTFRLGIDAGEDARYALLVCGEAQTSGGDRGSIDRRAGSRGRLLSPKAAFGDLGGCSEFFDSCAAPPNDEPVPDVVGMRPEEACETLDRNGYGGVFSGELVDDPAKPGRVVGQHPPPGSSDSEEAQIVDLLVSRSSSDRPLQPPRGCVNGPGENTHASAIRNSHNDL